MKRVLSLILCMVSLLVLAVPAFAAERTEGNVVYPGRWIHRCPGNRGCQLCPLCGKDLHTKLEN